MNIQWSFSWPIMDQRHCISLKLIVGCHLSEYCSFNPFQMEFYPVYKVHAITR